MQFRNEHIRRGARLLCRLDVTKVQVLTLYLGNLDKPRPGCSVGAGPPLGDCLETCPRPPQGVVQSSLTMGGFALRLETESPPSYQLSSRFSRLPR